MSNSDGKIILRVGIIGTVIAALCCFTPLLVITLGAVGLSAWLGWLDYVLLPAMMVFLGIAAYGFYLRRGKAVQTCCTSPNEDKRE